MFDYIIIGAGSAGSVIANRLTQDPTTSVLLLEAGGPDEKGEIHDPAAWLTLLGSELDWSFWTEEEPHTGGRKFHWPRGKVMGGSSSINAMLYVRGNRLDFDHWSSLGNAGWSHDEVVPYFKRSEHFAGPASELRGVGGPLHVSEHPSISGYGAAFIEAAVQAGYPRNPDYNGADQLGVAPFQNTIKDGTRQSTATAFLAPVLSRPNLRIETRAHAKRLVAEGTRITGVEYVQDDQLHTVRAGREVVLCAGAVGSPVLLMHSGIGPAEDLRALGIPIIADLPGVGQNLQDHLLVPLGYVAKKALPLPRRSNLVEANVFVKCRPERRLSPPELQLLLGAFLLFPPEATQGRSGCTLSAALVAPNSRGRIQLRTANPLDPPLIHAGYLECVDDENILVSGVMLSRELGRSPVLADVWEEAFAPDGDHEVAVRAYVRQTVSTLFHPVGTCKMGLDRMAVVTPALRVYGVDGCASPMRRSCRGSPMATPTPRPS